MHILCEMGDSTTTCKICGGEAIEGQHIPAHLDIRRGSPLCKDCHEQRVNDTIEKYEEEERRTAMNQQYMDDMPEW